jgi:hypothetical protein
MRITPIALVATALLCAAGCASQLNQQRLVETQSAIDSAEEIEDVESPEVSLHIKYAREQMAAAKRLLDEGEDEDANRMLDRAHADAQLALAKARTERSRREAKEAWSEVEELRNAQ